MAAVRSIDFTRIIDKIAELVGILGTSTDIILMDTGTNITFQDVINEKSGDLCDNL